jgi:hypothetical protein
MRESIFKANSRRLILEHSDVWDWAWDKTYSGRTTPEDKVRNLRYFAWVTIRMNREQRKKYPDLYGYGGPLAQYIAESTRMARSILSYTDAPEVLR